MKKGKIIMYGREKDKEGYFVIDSDNCNSITELMLYNILWAIRGKKAEPKKTAEKKEEPKEEAKSFVCKKCGATFENRGKFMSHCKKEHPKGAE